jgi:hypothetical protein
VISYLVDIVLLVALAATAIRVGAMHRELRRLRTYQTQYVQVFGETSRAADNIGDALRQIGGEGSEALRRLETAIGKATDLAKKLENFARAAERRPAASEQDEIGIYSAKPPVNVAAEASAPRPATPAPRNEILKFASDSRRPADQRSEAAAEPKFTPLQPDREIRLAPSVRTLRAAGGNGR